MPITVKIPERELYDEANDQFIEIKARSVTLEHSLLSISKWESKWHKPFFANTDKTREEMMDYIRCMAISGGDQYFCYGLSRQNEKEIFDYINDPMTATTINRTNTKKNHDVITSELVYYWMTALNIPFSCEKWHINRLFMLIEIASIKNQPPKKMSKNDILRRNHSLNAARRAKYGSKG